MSKISVYKTDGTQNGEIELNPLVFDSRVNERLLQLVLKAYAGNQRRGTADTKGKKEVSGGGKKPWKQKGTGRARQGSIRSPQWRGGGTVFGPTPRDYDTHIPKKIRQKALISALSLRNQQSEITVIEDILLSDPKTKHVVKMMEVLKLNKSRNLCVLLSVDEKLKRAAQNLKEVFSLKRADDLNAYHLLRRKHLVIAKSALPMIEKRALEVKNAKESVAA